MQCPYCKDDDDRVVDTRSGDSGTIIRRRRECLSCARRFSSVEKVEHISINVLKKSGKKEPFDIQKVIARVNVACRKRPITQDQIISLADRVERKSMESENREISSKSIGDFIMRELKRLDSVAFVRLSSVYKDYHDVEQFVKAIKSIKASK